MQFNTKIAVVIRTDLEAWQKLNVAAFLAGGIAAAFPECVGEPYEDGSGTQYLSLIGQPILIYGAVSWRFGSSATARTRASGPRATSSPTVSLGSTVSCSSSSAAGSSLPST